MKEIEQQTFNQKTVRKQMSKINRSITLISIHVYQQKVTSDGERRAS